MQADRSLFPALARPGGSVGGARHARPARTIRRYAVRGIFVLALAFSTLAALAWSAHGSGHPGHHHAVVATNVVPKGWAW
jgi:hypothetical protein